jgi:hypothetical protein
MSQNKSKHPSHKVFIVEKYGEDESFWTEVGAVWTHADGQGFNLVPKKGIAITGPVTIRTVKDEDRYRKGTGE